MPNSHPKVKRAERTNVISLKAAFCSHLFSSWREPPQCTGRAEQDHPKDVIFGRPLFKITIMKPFAEHDDMLSLVSRYVSSHIPSTTWTYVESSFILHRFHLHEFTYLLKFTWSSRINTRGTFVVICIYGQSGENSQLLTHMFPTEVKQGESLPSFSSHVSTTILFSLFSTTFLSFCWWLHT